MSGSAAISRAKARRGTSAYQESPNASEAFGHLNPIKEEKSPDQLLLEHDYKIYVYEQKLKELYKMIIEMMNAKKLESTVTKKDPEITDDLMAEALSSLDGRLEMLEHGPNKEIINDRMTKIETEQKELKNLLLKVQAISMETNLKLMQLKSNDKGETTVVENTNESITENVNNKSKTK